MLMAISQIYSYLVELVLSKAHKIAWQLFDSFYFSLTYQFGGVE